MEENLIRVIEQDYQLIKQKHSSSKNFIYINPVTVFLNLVENDSFKMKHYFDRKNNRRTQFLYCRNNLQAYFSDVDVLLMLLQIEDAEKQEQILNAFAKWLREDTEEGYIEYNETRYSFRGINWCGNGFVFHTLKDIDVPEEDVICIINLIIAKDSAVTELGKGKHDFAKRTVKKYFALLKWYWFKDKNVEKMLKKIGYRTEVDLISNYDPASFSEWKKMDLRFQEIDIE